MAQVRGSFAQLTGAVKETAFGVTPAVTTAMLTLPIISFQPNATRATSESRVITSKRDASTPSQGRLTVDPSAEVPVDTIAFGYWLQKFFGDPTTTGAGPTYTHTFKTGNSLDSWILESKYSDGASFNEYFLYNGVKVNSINFTCDWGNDSAEIAATVGMIASKVTASGTSVDDTPTAISYTPFSLSGFAFTEGGSSLCIGSISLNMSNNLDGNIFTSCGGGIRGDIPEGKITVSGTVRAMFDSMTQLTKAMNFTESALVLTGTAGTSSLAISIAELKYEMNIPPVTGPEGVWLDMNFNGYYDNGSDASVIKAVLVNSQAAYIS